LASDMSAVQHPFTTERGLLSLCVCVLLIYSAAYLYYGTDAPS